MLTRSLDEIVAAARRLPDHLVQARRFYGDSPQAVRALLRLQDALMEVDAALFHRSRAPSIPGCQVAEGAHGRVERD